MTQDPSEHAQDFRAGFAVFVGRPNVGKSTLTNALVGRKVAITSNRPQTTRHTIRGIVHRPDGQLILVDTPGLHRPRTLLGQRLNDVVAETLGEVDVIGFCVPADQKVGPGDRYIAQQVVAAVGRTPVVAIVTKADLVPQDRLMEQLLAVSELGREVVSAERVQREARRRRRDAASSGPSAPARDRDAAEEEPGWAHVIPVSAADGFQVDELGELLVSLMPVSPPLYPEGDLTDEPEVTMMGELIREAALEGVRDELPHSLAVVVDEVSEREGRSAQNPMLDVHASLYVERPSQKAIVIGKRGARLREIGTRARSQIEALLGTRIYLDLHVKVAKEWQRDPKQLSKLGF
ncbi:GTPase Era [Kocuria rhizophila]|uniref:GTPase Era n=1 Tax=Kocuria rhizophila (strain ATCC 9341 / DSM 348 / NBRC 103217 / DC2201) TaxID=378753 RepID=B2GHT9_KOCRD|nr:GTPase Era [Kocuria rhizophila]ASE10477.1 GTPase Era [Kocuria rhizophila]BAG29642.1 GTP-binding protein Era [Kocuria rhizophila DC2201]VEH75080.1 GTPase Era [Kocuria rhizophila]